MKRIAILLMMFLALAVAASAQDRRNFTVEEVKEIQREERTSLENRQKETFKDLLETQKEQLSELKSVTSQSYRVADMLQNFIVERKDLTKLHSDERAKLAALHNAERIAFQNHKL